MFSPIKWIKPRLRSLCVAFGAADMTLVLISGLCWYFIFNAGFEAQHIQSLYRSQHKDDEGEATTETVHFVPGADVIKLKKFKEDRTAEDLRLERTIRACGYVVDENNRLDETLTDSNYAGPAALIGAAMGSFFILGALLTSLNSIGHPAARRVVCGIAIIGEGVSSFFLFVGVAILSTNDGLCRTEYYYERFQPVLYLFTFTMIFIFTYKTYEVTIIAFYLGEQTNEAIKEHAEVEHIKRKTGGHRESLSTEVKQFHQHLSAKNEVATGKSKETPKQGLKDRGAQGDMGAYPRQRPPNPPHNSTQKDDDHQAALNQSLHHAQEFRRKSHAGSGEVPQHVIGRHFRKVREGPHHAGNQNEGSEQRGRRKSNFKDDGRRIAGSEERVRKQEEYGIDHVGSGRKSRSQGSGRGDGYDSKGSSRRAKDQVGGGGGDGEDRARKKAQKHIHHHPLHPTKKKAPIYDASTDNLSGSNEMNEAHQKKLLSLALSEFSGLGHVQDL